VTFPGMAPQEQETRRYYGKYPAVVVANGAPEDGPHHRGEVLVRVHGILEEDPSGSGERPLEVVAKPCLPPGFFFVPEPEDRLWVEFAAGDIDSPLWSGVWYADGAPPQTPDGDPPTEHQKVIRTAKGHVVLLDDTDGAEQLVLLDGTNNNRVTCDQDGILIEDANGNSITLGADGIELTDKNGNALTMDASGVVLAGSSGRKVQIDASSIKVSDATGGTQAPVALATLLNWLLAHQHTGNMGAPTPLFPVDLGMLNAQKPTMVSGT
jgi:hypothetical protein